MNNYILDTANYDKYNRALRAATVAKMETKTDYRANCFKCYRLEIIAKDPGQDYILNLIACASFSAPGQDDYIRKLTEYSHGNYTSPQDFIDNYVNA